MNRLKNHRCYLAGPIDAAPDLGEGWRKMITPILQNKYQLKVFDPLTKPIQNHQETVDIIRDRHKLKKEGEYDKIAPVVKEIRRQDLRATDGADFAVVYMTRTIPHYGTMEEVVTMNRSKKPILVMFEQGKTEIYDWLLGMFPHEYVFDSWAYLLNYLDYVHTSPDFVDPHRRWVFWEEDEKEKLKDEILSLAQNLLCEWAEFDHEMFFIDKLPSSISDCLVDMTQIRNEILDKFKLLQEKTHA